MLLGGGDYMNLNRDPSLIELIFLTEVVLGPVGSAGCEEAMPCVCLVVKPSKIIFLI